MLLLEKLEQKRKYIVAIIVVCVILGAIYSLFGIPKVSTAESTLMLIEKEEKSEDDFKSKGNLELTKKMVSNFEEIIKSESSITSLNESLKTNISVTELKNKIQVKENSNSDTFKIVIENADLNLAVKINKELIQIFSEKLKTIYTNTEVYIVDNAHIEENINYALIIKVMVISVVIGIVINVIYILSLIEIDKRVKKSNDIESELALKNLGKIPLNKSKNKLIDEKEKTSYSIAFRNLRSNIQFINVNNKEKNTILVTSSKKSEGKTVISANIAISFAKTGKKVIVIDADMNSGKIDKIFNIPNDLGLSNYLSGIDENGAEVNERINKFIKDTAIKNLNVITSGTIPPNSSELLAMLKFEEMIKDLSVFYDVIILDGTQVLNATDALILTRIANSTIIVSNYKKTKKDDLWHTKRDIQNVGGRIIGIIINKVKIKEESEKIYNKTRKVLKEKYLKLKDYIITKRDNRKQKLLDAAIIEEKQKVAQELKNEENRLIEEIEKERLEEKKKEEKVSKPSIFSNIALNVNQIINKEKDQGKNKEKSKDEIISKNENKQDESVEEIEESLIPQKEEKVQENISEEKKSENIENLIEEDKENTKFTKLVEVKEKIILFGKNLKAKSLDEIAKIGESAKKEVEKVKEAQKQAQEKKIEKIKEEVAQEKIKESKEIIRENSETSVPEKKFDEFKQETSTEEKDENSVLVIVDAENGYCRAFSQYCFTEKLIRGIDKTDGFVKANYSSSIVSRKRLVLMSKYDLTKKQADRIDTLIYTVLNEYDECVWVERKMVSNKAEDYVLCMAKDYERSASETKLNYELRCQYLRKVELAKAQIEIEYKLDNIWNSNQINFTDKIMFCRFAQKYENLKERRKAEQRENNSQVKRNIKLKNPIELLKKIKIDEVKVKSIEELTKEVTEIHNQNDYENYQFEDYESYNGVTEQDLEEQRIKEEQERILRDQIRIKQEIKDKKAYEKAQKREARNKKRAEQRKNKELERQKAKEEARIEEELLVDNLYPKTKNNKNL